MYKRGHAYSHGVYIRPGEYVSAWRAAKRMADDCDVSLSEFINHVVYLFLEGEQATYSKVASRKRGRRAA